MSIKRAIVWFRNDLRVQDNPVLQATRKDFNEVLCVYCFDPRHYQATSFSSHKTGIYRAKFLIESVANLRKNLKSIGCELLVALEKPENIIPKLTSNVKNASVIVMKEVTYEEIRVENKVEKKLTQTGSGINFTKVVGGCCLYHPDDLPFDEALTNMPDVFTPYKDKVEKFCHIRPLSPVLMNGHLPRPVSAEQLISLINDHCSYEYLPSVEDLGLVEDLSDHQVEWNKKGVMVFAGGEDAALQRIDDWMFKGDNLKNYFDIRNGMLGEGYSSKMSPWLAAGCISPRQIYYAAKRYETERNISNKSTYWLIWELTCRDYFRNYCKKYGSQVFLIGGAKGVNKPWNVDEESIRKWKTGTTGQPLVDANMRELLYTGWMSNRGRQNVASYLVHELGVDWRVGADHFESLLIDHDVCSNYGNWNAAAGLTGGRINKFNCVKQSSDYDPHAHYIRHWLPELQHAPAPKIFQPSKFSVEEQERYCVVIGQDYPGELAPATSTLPHNSVVSNGERGGKVNGGRGGGKGRDRKGSSGNSSGGGGYGGKGKLSY